MMYVKLDLCRSSLLLSAFVVAGCAATRSAADRAFADGDFAGAATLYEDEVAADPDDDDLQSRLRDARERAILALLDTHVAWRSDDHAALATTKVIAALAMLRDWQHDPSTQLHQRLTDAVQWSNTKAVKKTSALLEAGQPLAAELTLGDQPLLIRYGDGPSREARLRTLVKEAGKEKCHALTGQATSAPHLNHLLARYCAHFQVHLEMTELPGTVSGIAVNGGPLGMPEAQQQALKERLEEALRASHWHSPQATGMSTAILTGSHKVSFRQKRVKLKAPLLESSADESPAVEQEPPVKARPQRRRKRSRRAAKRRQKQRQQEQVFRYRAVEHTGVYVSEWRVELRAPHWSQPLVVTLSEKESHRGLAHNVTHEPAAVMPSQPELLPAEEWTDINIAKFVAAFEAALSKHGQSMYCEAAEFTPEEAARCLFFGTEETPVAALDALETFFGVSPQLVLALGPPPSAS